MKKIHWSADEVGKCIEFPVHFFVEFRHCELVGQLSFFQCLLPRVNRVQLLAIDLGNTTCSFKFVAHRVCSVLCPSPMASVILLSPTMVRCVVC